MDSPSLGRLGPVSAACLWLAAAACPAAEFRFLGPGNYGFDYTFDDWSRSVSPTAIRLTDNTPDGWGGAGRGLNPPLDLSGLADGRFEVDFTTQSFNAADAFSIELYDTAGRSGYWTFPATLAPQGVAQRRVSPTTLANPVSGVGDFRNLDLSQISLFQVVGNFGSPARFDMSFGSVRAATGLAAPPPYEGYEPDAPWRAVAAQRIDEVRKADLNVQVFDATGAPLPGALVQVEQTKHAFGFGSAVQAWRLRDNAPQHVTYKAKVRELFNLATIENNLKWPAWEGEWGSFYTQSGANSALNWINNNGLEARGHVMVWPGTANLPADLQALLSGGPLNAAQQQQLRDRIAAHISEVGTFTDGRTVAWDVVNEPRTNHDVMDALPEGDAAMAEWFRLARAANPSAELYLNEYDILASGGQTDTGNQRLLEDQVRALQSAGAPIDGVGLQGHFNTSNLTGPEALWAIVDRYADLGLNVQVTEFDFGTTDEQLQAAYLRDFFTAMFAHEGVSDLVMWGFWEGAHYDPIRALFRQDWSAKPAGEAYLDLVFNQWWTDVATQTGASGGSVVRAFKGDHQVGIAFGGQTVSGPVTVDDDGVTINAILPILLGDYSRDGAVDAADYTLWRDTLGESVLAPGLGADGDGDGVVGLGDLEVLRSRYGARLPASFAVPEPMGLAPPTLAALLGVIARPFRR